MGYFRPEYCWVFAVGCIVFFTIHTYLLFSVNDVSASTHVFLFLTLVFAGMFGGCKGGTLRSKYGLEK